MKALIKDQSQVEKDSALTFGQLTALVIIFFFYPRQHSGQGCCIQLLNVSVDKERVNHVSKARGEQQIWAQQLSLPARVGEMTRSKMEVHYFIQTAGWDQGDIAEVSLVTIDTNLSCHKWLN